MILKTDSGAAVANRANVHAASIPTSRTPATDLLREHSRIGEVRICKPPLRDRFLLLEGAWSCPSGVPADSPRVAATRNSPKDAQRNAVGDSRASEKGKSLTPTAGGRGGGEKQKRQGAQGGGG